MDGSVCQSTIHVKYVIYAIFDIYDKHDICHMTCINIQYIEIALYIKDFDHFGFYQSMTHPKLLRTSMFGSFGAQWDSTQLLGLYLYWHTFKFSIVPIDKYILNHSFQPTKIYQGISSVFCFDLRCSNIRHLFNPITHELRIPWLPLNCKALNKVCFRALKCSNSVMGPIYKNPQKSS